MLATYRAGLIRLFGPAHEKWANDTIVAVAQALRYWLLRQFIEMALVGVLTTLAVWRIGPAVPSGPWRDRRIDGVCSGSHTGGDSPLSRWR